MGKSQNASITSCGNLAKVSAYADSSEPRSGGYWATYARAGGIAGVIKGDISNSYNAGEIIAAVTGNHAYSYAGGIVSSSGNNILNCYNTGSVKSVGNPNNDAGGIAGGYSTGMISNCFNTGNIISEGDAGGATGYLGSGTIINFYNIGNIIILENYHYAGGVVGYYEEEAEATIENSYYVNTTPKGIGKGSDSTTSCDLLDMKKPITFIGFDFDNVWTFDGNSEYLYPELKNVGTICVHRYDNICDDKCNICNATREISHLYTWIVDKQNTCGESGVKYEECTICHIKRNEGVEIEASGKHSYVWVTTIEPTCGLNGSRYEKCTICGSSGITETIPATTNHNFEWVIDKAETCGKEGQKHQECIVCHLKQNEGTKILSTGKHSYDNDCDTVCNKCSIERVVNPHTYDNDCDITCNTCQKVREVGEHKYDNACDTICNVCQSIREVEPHKYYAVYLADGSIHWLECAICEHKKDVGEHTYSNSCDTTCNICQSLRETEPHKYDDACDESCNICGSIRTIMHDYDDATCKAPKTCKVCGATSGTKLSHKSDSGTVTKKATCTAIGAKTYKCTLCEEVIKTEAIVKIAHKYDSGKVTKAATCKSTGVKAYTCSVCKGKKTETIVKSKTHSYVAATCTKAKTCKYCGKTSGKKIGHKYIDVCDTKCNVCKAKRTAPHKYSNACDSKCNICKTKRKAPHKYTNPCDTICNLCKVKRTIKHTYTAATCTKPKTCSVCKKTSGKVLGHNYKNEICKKCGEAKYNYLVYEKKKGGYIVIGTAENAPKNIVIPNKFKGLPVVSIGDSAFAYNSKITSIKFSSNVLSIGECAFEGCYNLKKITIGDNVSKIGKYAFHTCKNIRTIKIPSNVKEISAGAFDGCSKLSSLTIASGVQKIGNGAFAGTSLSTVTIPNSVKSIGSSAFNSCEKLLSVVIGDGISKISNGTFSYCEKLMDITISKKVKSIDAYAFYFCKNLKSINFDGTKSDWESIVTGEYWNDGAPITTINCSDGKVILNINT